MKIKVLIKELGEQIQKKNDIGKGCRQFAEKTSKKNQNRHCGRERKMRGNEIQRIEKMPILWQ